MGIRRFGLRLRVLSQLLPTAIGIGLIAMIHDAVTSRSVVIDPIDIAPTIADRAASGKIVAAELLDVLTRIQAATRSSAASRRCPTP